MKKKSAPMARRVGRVCWERPNPNRILWGLMPRSREKQNVVTRKVLLEAVHRACPRLSRSEARDIFEMTLGGIVDGLEREGAVKLRGFGIFSVHSKLARPGRNPKTRVAATITPRRVLTFKPSDILRAAVASGGYDRAAAALQIDKMSDVTVRRVTKRKSPSVA
jgi:integration host factor subunit alpha